MARIKFENLRFQQGNFSMELSLDISDGEMFCLLGPSGSGKTTLLRLLSGFITPMNGGIFLDNEEITRESVERRQLAYLFQDLALFPHMNAQNNVAFGLKVQGWSRDKRLKRAKELLDWVGLGKYGHRPIYRLSGGEQQRVALARALAISPKALLLDEPLSALDSQIRTQLGKEIRQIQRTNNLTTLWVTHDQEEALNLSDRICLLKDGRIIEMGTPSELYHSPKNSWTASFLGESLLLKIEEQDDQTAKTTWGNFPKKTSEEFRYVLLRPDWISTNSPLQGIPLAKLSVSKREFSQRGHRWILQLGNQEIPFYGSSTQNVDFYAREYHLIKE